MKHPGLFLLAIAIGLAGCRSARPTIDPIPATVNPTATPSIELTIVEDGFERSSLDQEARTFLAELESAYLAAVQAQATPLRGSTLIETLGAQGPGAYLQDTAGGHWLLHRNPARQAGVMQQVPDVAGSRRSWDRENNRFVYEDAQGHASRAYVPSLNAVLPFVGGLVWSGFTPEQLELAEEALTWLGQVAPQRLEFLQRLGIPIVLFRGRNEVVVGQVDRRGIVLYRDAFSLEGSPSEINRLWFLSVLYHEAIHVRQGPGPRTACQSESEAVAEEIGLMRELRAFISASHRFWVELLIHAAEQYAALSCGLPTPTPISFESGPTDSYLAQVAPIYRGWGEVADEWKAWLGGLGRYERDGYALEGWWDHFCGLGWYYERVAALLQQLSGVAPPQSAQEFHAAFQDLLRSHLEEEGAKEDFCANADPTPGYMGNTDLWEAWMGAVERTRQLAVQVGDLFGRLLS